MGESYTTAGKQHFPPTKIQRTCIYGTPYSHPECRIYYMEYRNDTFLEFLEGENVSEPAVYRAQDELNKYQQRASLITSATVHGPLTISTMTFLLNCFVLGDDEERVFSIEIAKDKNVGILKKLIREENTRLFTDVDAKDLDLWKVCLPIDGPDSKQPQTGPPLRINKRLSMLWDGDPSDDDLHILVKAPGTAEQDLIHSLLNSFKSNTNNRFNSSAHSHPQLSFSWRHP